MNLPRFYCREALSPGAHIDLPEPVARHAVRVLRLPPGASMILFDGRGGEYEAHIEPGLWWFWVPGVSLNENRSWS